MSSATARACASERVPLDLLNAVDRAVRDRAGSRQRGDSRSWLFRCPLPGHVDEHPSATWDRGRGVFYCPVCKHGGGAFELAERLEVPLPARAARTETAYDYSNGAGRLVFQVVRTEPGKDGAAKAFAQRRPDGAGGWTWKLTGCDAARGLVYRLPEVLAAIAAGREVLIVEGEKDVHTAERLGSVATCNAGGAGAWLPAHAAHLRGARVVVVPDNDSAGEDHARTVVASLRGVAADVRLLRLPNLPAKGDLTDWAAARASAGLRPEAIAAELRELVAAAPGALAVAESLATSATTPAPPVAVCMATVDPQPVRWLWRPRIARGKVTNMEGDPGQGKSAISLAVATALSLGRNLPGESGSTKGETLIFTAEDGLADTLRPRLDAMGADCRLIHAIADPLDFSPKGQGLGVVEREVARLRPALVIVDPIVAYLGGRTDAHRANEVRAILAPLAAIADAHGCAILAIRHLSKGRSGRALHAGGGSVDFVAAARSVLLAGSTADGSARALIQVKNNLGPLAPAIGYSIDDGRFSWTGASNLTAADLLGAEDPAECRGEREDAEAWLRDALAGGPVAAVEIIRAAKSDGISERTLKRAKAALGAPSRRVGATWEWCPAGGQEGQGCQEGPKASLASLAPLPGAGHVRADL